MPKYQGAPVEATRWFRNGDHPDDEVDERIFDPMSGESYLRMEGQVVRFFRRPEPQYAGSSLHLVCGFQWHEHGWIDSGEDGQTVCPGDWVVTDAPGQYRVVKTALFNEVYQQVREGDERDTLIEQACEVMHEAYESAALGEGWKTQEASAVPWA